MNKILISGLAIVVLAGCGTQQVTQQPEQPDFAQQQAQHDLVTIAPEAFKAEVDAGKGMVLDIRTDEELAQGRIVAQPLHLDFYAPDFREKLSALDRSALYLLHCRSGSRSSQALAIMKELGFVHVHELRGGITAWSASGYPLVK